MHRRYHRRARRLASPRSCGALARAKAGPDRAARVFPQKWSLLGREELTKACLTSLEDVRRHCADIPCMGCRSAIESLLTQLAARPNGTSIGPFSVLEERVVKLRGDIASNPEAACEALLGCRHAEMDSWITKSKSAQKGNRRCPLHSLKPRPVGAWVDVWLLMSDECHRVVLSALTAETFEDALQAYLRKHKFCSHCRSVVLEAYDMLILDRHSSRTADGLSDESDEDGHGHSDEEDMETSAEADIAHAERMFKKLSYVDGRIVIPNDSTYVQELLDRAERSMRGEEQSHHVKQGSLGQDEVLSCLGGCLYEELQNLWRQMVNNERSWCMLQHGEYASNPHHNLISRDVSDRLAVFPVVSSATLTNVEVKVDEKTGDAIMMELLAEEEASKQADEQKKSKKKRQKDKKKAKLAEKKAEEEEEEEKAAEPEPEPEPAAAQVKKTPVKSKKERKKEQAAKERREQQQLKELNRSYGSTNGAKPMTPRGASGSETSEGSEGELLENLTSQLGGSMFAMAGAGEDDLLADPEAEEESGGLSEAEIAAFKNKYAKSDINKEKEKRAEKLRQNWDMRKAKGVTGGAGSVDLGAESVGFLG